MSTTNCEDVSARMVELLYGELPADARSGVDAHVAGCARCRSELDGLEKTRAVARRALDESPPRDGAGLILRRAAEHLAAQQQPAAAAAAAIVPAGKAKKAAQPQQGSLWDWLRSRWTLPSLATVGAVALLVIGLRVLLEPNNVDYKGSPEFQREARQAAAPTVVTVEPAAPEAKAAGESFAADRAPAPAQPAPAEASAIDETDRARIRAEAASAKASASAKSSASARHRSAGVAKAEAKPSAAVSAPPRASGPVYNDKLAASADSGRSDKGKFAPPPPPKPVTGFKMADDDPSGAPAAAPSGSRRAAAPSKDDGIDGLLSSAEKPPAPAKAGGAGSRLGGYGAGGGGGGKVADRSVAKERPAPAAPAPRVAEPAAAPPAAAAMPPPPAPEPAARHEVEKSEKKAKRAPAAADEESAAAPAPREGTMAGKSKPSAETAVARANRLFTEGRWAEAAAAYRELLRRDPNNSEAARWRQRLAVAEAALESRRPTEPARAAPTQ